MYTGAWQHLFHVLNQQTGRSTFLQRQENFERSTSRTKSTCSSSCSRGKGWMWRQTCSARGLWINLQQMWSLKLVVAIAVFCEWSYPVIDLFELGQRIRVCYTRAHKQKLLFRCISAGLEPTSIVCLPSHSPHSQVWQDAGWKQPEPAFCH